MTKKAFPALFLCAVALSLLVRTARLDLRPMHHDEANQAYKFGDLLDRGEYRYDPEEHHGPSLYYLTLPLAKAMGIGTYAELDETILRLVPALFGTAILLLLLLLKGGLSDEAVLFSGLTLALSPVMSFYSRFYIQEILLVFFLAGLIAAGWRFFRTGSPGWAAAAGFSAGMMFATKETSLILFASAGAALVIGRFAAGWRRSGAPRTKIPPAARFGARKTVLSATVFAGSGLATVGPLFTSFLKNLSGLRDSVLAFGTYFERAGTAGAHAHPWHYYLQTMAWSRFGNGTVWSEAFVLALAVVGGVVAIVPGPGKNGGVDSSGFRRFVLFFTLIAVAIYSLIPYKTPWNMMPFVFGIILLAGSGAVALWRTGRTPVAKIAVAVVLALGFASLGYQSYRANFVDYANSTNPYVYAQTSLDFLKLVDSVEGVAGVAPEGRDLLIKVIALPEETWPLPWSLRKFGRVGYWTGVEEAGDFADAPVVISSAAFTGEIDARLEEGYQSAFYGLRPEVVLALYVRRDLWEKFMEIRAKKTPGDRRAGAGE